MNRIYEGKVTAVELPRGKMPLRRLHNFIYCPHSMHELTYAR